MNTVDLKAVELERVVWKFSLDTAPVPQELEIPFESKILHVDIQGDRVTMWTLVDPEASTEVRTFHVVATGQKFKMHARRQSRSGVISEWLSNLCGDGMVYVGTAICGELVWHVFEEVSV